MPEPRDVISRIVTPPPAPPGLHLVAGPREMQGLVLFSLVPRLHDGLTVYWIDAGNGFDAYGLGRAARAARLDERRVLARVQVARPFTAIQMTAMLAKKIPRLPPACPVILADPMALFYDPEMPEEEVARLFRDFLGVVKTLASPLLTLAVQRDVPETRKTLSKRLLQEAKTVAHFRPAPRLA
jgi:hypothetical protein